MFKRRRTVEVGVDEVYELLKRLSGESVRINCYEPGLTLYGWENGMSLVKVVEEWMKEVEVEDEEKGD